MKIVRSIREQEVIAHFLRYEFYHEEFHRDREQFEPVVMNPDLNDPEQVALRRALLLRRRSNVWLELPPDTRWVEVEIEREDLPKMKVFTRGHWAKMTGNNHHVLDFVERVRAGRISNFAYRHLTKVQSVRYRLRDSTEVSTVFLLGVDEHSPTTILEGNNRLTAVLLDSFDLWRTRFRFFVALSPQMAGCVFYDCSWANFVPYAFRNLKRRIFRNTGGLTVEKQSHVSGGLAAEWRVQPSTGSAWEQVIDSGNKDLNK
jgi:hypothetical protein